jgi:3-oxoacyl-[acyl-carrier-protein] synthase II
MKDAGVTAADIDYINAHGTSTPANDLNETKAIKAVFGECAGTIHVSSTKSMTGHMLGAAGAVEFIFCGLATRDSIIPPTINYETPDPDLDLNYTPNKAVKHPVKLALSNSFGFGGHNVSLAIRRFPE